MSVALNGVRVVDFGQYVAGPLLAELLAEHGADVIHVDPPGGPRLPGLPDAFLNRGKQRIVLDLANQADLATARELVSTADVLVENFRPGVMARIGLGPEVCADANPTLIYCSLPGFAADDPRAAIPAWEGIVMSATAGYRRSHEHWDWKARSSGPVPEPGRPLFTALPIASTTAALLGALAVIMGLLQRERTGAGARLEIPLSEAMLEVVGFHLEMPDFVGRRDDLPRPFLGSYLCADGRHVDQVPYPKFVERLLRKAGVWHEWVSVGLGDLGRVFVDPELKLRAEERFSRLVRTRSAADWESIAIEIGTPFAQVRSPQEWLVNDHARASGAVVSVDDPEYGVLDLCGPCIQADGSPLRLGSRSLPDADREGILASHRRAPRMSARQPGFGSERPLSGVAVVELSQVVAGPIAGRLLADYGADVLKVANPSPSGNNGFHGSFTNRGKSTVFVDVQDEDERRRLRSAIRDADVLLQNYAAGAVERYGLGYDELRTVHPGLVYVSLSAFGRTGPWQHRRGHENQAAAATGLSARYGGAAGWPRYQPYLVSDVGTGIVGAIAAALGLYRRAQTGTGQHLSSSLAHVATLHQALYLFGTDRPAARLPEPTGTEARGWNALQRLYEVADGWIFLAAPPSKAREVADAVGLPTTDAVGLPTTEVDPHLDEDGPFAAALSARLVERTAAEWMHVLVPLDVAVQAVREIAAVAHDPCWHRRGILRYARNGEGQEAAPVLGAGPQPWPLPTSSLRHPGPLGTGAIEPRATDSIPITMHHGNRHTDRSP